MNKIKIVKICCLSVGTLLICAGLVLTSLYIVFSAIAICIALVMGFISADVALPSRLSRVEEQQESFNEPVSIDSLDVPPEPPQPQAMPVWSNPVMQPQQPQMPQYWQQQPYMQPQMPQQPYSNMQPQMPQPQRARPQKKVRKHIV